MQNCPTVQMPDDKFGFAKLRGKDFEYYVKKYELTFGRKSKSKGADFCLGNNLNMSRQHARLHFAFERERWELEVIGKNGVHVNGELFTPDKSPAVLSSKQLITMGEVKFYFLLPTGGSGVVGGRAASGGGGGGGNGGEVANGIGGGGSVGGGEVGEVIW